MRHNNKWFILAVKTKLSAGLGLGLLRGKITLIRVQEEQLFLFKKNMINKYIFVIKCKKKDSYCM